MKTPIQELINRLDYLIAVLPEGAAKNQLIIARNKAESMLEKEKEVITDAYEVGRLDNSMYDNYEDYYEQTFNRKEKCTRNQTI